MQDKKNSPNPRRVLPENALAYRVKIDSDGYGTPDDAAGHAAIRSQATKPTRPPIPNTFRYWAYRSA